MGKATFKKPPFTLDRSRRGGLVTQISDALRRAIETGYYSPGDVLPPVRDLAGLLGVSKGMAERAIAVIREEGRISPRPHVGCVVCDSSHPLWKGHVLSVVSPGLGNPFDNTAHATLRDTLTAAGYLVTSATVPESRPAHFDNFALLDTMMRQQVDLVVELHDKPNVAQWLSERGIPFARLTTDRSPLPANCVGVVLRRDDLALPDFAAHCREAGVRRVLQVRAWHGLDITDALGKTGISVATWHVPQRPDGSVHTAVSLSSWGVEAFTRQLAEMGRGWLPDLIFFDDDYLATGALMALANGGVRMPEDVRVASWANREYGPVSPKPLARMEMDNMAAGATLAKCVLEYLSTGKFPLGVIVGPKYFRGETITP